VPSAFDVYETSRIEKHNTYRLFTFAEFCRNLRSKKHICEERDIVQKPPLISFDGPLITSPDIQIAAKTIDDLNGDVCKWVLAESHNAIAPLSFFMRVIPNSIAWVEAVSNFLKSNLTQYHLVNICAKRTNKTSHTHPVSWTYEVEISAVAASSKNILSVEDIAVRIEKDKHAIAIHRPTGKRLLFLPPNSHASSGAISCFRTPSCFSKIFGTGPRVEKEGIVVKRATWQFHDLRFLGKLKTSFDIYIFVQLIKFTNKLPRWVYIKTDSSRKPVFIDFYNPFLCEEFARISGSAPSINVEEMYPTPDDLWLKTELGRYCCELRLLYVTPERDFPSLS
jgi:hypothetical protein